MIDIKVRVEKNQVQVTNDIQNFQVMGEDPYDLGDIIGFGATPGKALEDFRQMYECKYDEEVNAIIVD